MVVTCYVCGNNFNYTGFSLVPHHVGCPGFMAVIPAAPGPGAAPSSAGAAAATAAPGPVSPPTQAGASAPLPAPGAAASSSSTASQRADLKRVRSDSGGDTSEKMRKTDTRALAICRGDENSVDDDECTHRDLCVLSFNVRTFGSHAPTVEQWKAYETEQEPATIAASAPAHHSGSSSPDHYRFGPPGSQSSQDADSMEDVGEECKQDEPSVARPASTAAAAGSFLDMLAAAAAASMADEDHAKVMGEIKRIDQLCDFFASSGADVVCLYEIQAGVGVMKRRKSQEVAPEIKYLLEKLRLQMSARTGEHWGLALSLLNCAGIGKMRDAYVLLYREASPKRDVPTLSVFRSFKIMDFGSGRRMPAEIVVRIRWQLHDDDALLRFVLWHAPTFVDEAIAAMNALLDNEPAVAVNCPTLIAGDLNIDADYLTDAPQLQDEEIEAAALLALPEDEDDSESDDMDESAPGNDAAASSAASSSSSSALPATASTTRHRARKNFSADNRELLSALWDRIGKKYIRCAPRGGTTINRGENHISSQRGSTANALDHLLLERHQKVELQMGSIHDLIFHAMERTTLPEEKKKMSSVFTDSQKYRRLNAAFRAARNLVYRAQHRPTGLSDHHGITALLTWRCDTRCIPSGTVARPVSEDM